MKMLVAAAAALIFSFSTASAQSPAIEQGIQAFKARKYTDARAIFQPFASRDAVAAFYMGRISASEDDIDKAVDYFEKAVELNGRNAEYYDWLGRAYGNKAMKASKFKLPFLARKAKGAWDKGLAIDPNNLDIMEDLVQYYLQAPGFLGGSKDKAREMVNEVKKRNSYRGAVLSANTCGAQKDSACVEREIKGIIAAYPDTAATYASLAALYANSKQFDKAFEVIDQRMKKNPDDTFIIYALGRTAALSGQQMDRGEQALKNYLAHPPENAQLAGAHLRLGMIYAKRGNREAARKEYLTALQINPANAEAKKELAALGS
jgi:tetratricopeptide (TPR) repeat protein